MHPDLTALAPILCGCFLLGITMLVWSMLVAAAHADRTHERAWKNKKRQG